MGKQADSSDRSISNIGWFPKPIFKRAVAHINLLGFLSLCCPGFCSMIHARDKFMVYSTTNWEEFIRIISICLLYEAYSEKYTIKSIYIEGWLGGGSGGWGWWNFLSYWFYFFCTRLYIHHTINKKSNSSYSIVITSIFQTQQIQYIRFMPHVLMYVSSSTLQFHRVQYHGSHYSNIYRSIVKGPHGLLVSNSNGGKQSVQELVYTTDINVLDVHK